MKVALFLTWCSCRSSSRRSASTVTRCTYFFTVRLQEEIEILVKQVTYQLVIPSTNWSHLVPAGHTYYHIVTHCTRVGANFNFCNFRYFSVVLYSYREVHLLANLGWVGLG